MKIHPALLLAPMVAAAGPMEVSCTSPVHESVMWLDSNIERQTKECQTKGDNRCPSLVTLVDRLNACKSNDAQWGQRYVFHVDTSPGSSIHSGLADVFFAGCGTKTVAKMPRQAKISASPSTLTLDMSDPGLSTPMVFTIDRENLSGGFNGKANFHCEAKELARRSKL